MISPFSNIQSSPVRQPDVAEPGLTRFGPDTPVSGIGVNPWGVYKPQDPAVAALAALAAGTFFFQEITLTPANPIKMAFPEHGHILLDNQGIANIQFSKDGTKWFDVLPSGRAMVLDGHTELFLWVQCAGTTILVATTW